MFDEILQFLSGDGSWHTLVKIAAVTNHTEGEVRRALEFLATIELVTFNGEKALIDPMLRDIIITK